MTEEQEHIILSKAMKKNISNMQHKRNGGQKRKNEKKHA